MISHLYSSQHNETTILKPLSISENSHYDTFSYKIHFAKHPSVNVQTAKVADVLRGCSDWKSGWWVHEFKSRMPSCQYLERLIKHKNRWGYAENKWECRKDMGLLKRPPSRLLSQENVFLLCVSGAERWPESALSLHDKCTNSWTLPQSGQCRKCLVKSVLDRMLWICWSVYACV